MNLDGIRVHHAGLEQAAQDLRDTVTRIDTRMNQLEGELNPLRHGWAGNARTAYDGAKARWDAAIAEMRDLLAQTSGAVQQSNAEYLAADARGARAFER